jgi:glutathione S-transferase
MVTGAARVFKLTIRKRAKIRRPEAIKLSNEEIDARCDHILKLMDTHLAKREWLALERPTIVDLSCFGPISMLKVSGYDTDKWPNVTRWLGRIKALPGAHDIDGNVFAMT